MINRLKSAVFFFCIFCCLPLYAVEFPAVPNPFRYVNDYTNTLHTTERQVLENKLISYSQETSSQIAVVIIPSTQGYEIAQYAFELGDKWGIGRKQHNNGVLMLIALNDRKVFIATGQGLEGVLPDALLSQIIRQVITPQFKQGFYASGIERGLDYIIAASKGEFAPEPEEDSWEDYIPFLIFALFVLFILFSEIKERRTPYTRSTIPHSTLSRHYRSHGGFGSGNGGFGGSSGFGGGGGFGGGSFGGGGAGGSW